MKKHYLLHGFTVEVIIEEGLIRVNNDSQLKRAIESGLEKNTASLVDWIKADHLACFNKVLNIGDRSLIVEIWGHLYFEYFLFKYSKLLRIILTFGLYKRFRRSCVVIDCGEHGKDPNRRFWDFVAPLQNWLGKWLSNIRLSTFAER